MNLSDELRKLAADVEAAYPGLPLIVTERIAALATRLEAGESKVFNLILAAHVYAGAARAVDSPLGADSLLHRKELAEARLQLETAALDLEGGHDDEN